MYFEKFTVILFLSCFSSLFSQSIILFEKDATVWGREQEIEGRLLNFYEHDVILHLNSGSLNSSVNLPDSSFSIPIVLGEGLSKLLLKPVRLNPTH